jgi:hypothetical protein
MAQQFEVGDGSPYVYMNRRASWIIETRGVAHRNMKYDSGDDIQFIGCISYLPMQMQAYAFIFDTITISHDRMTCTWHAHVHR